MSEIKTRMKTRCYYTDYVNHMIRFYLSTPNGLDLTKREYTAASIKNWTSVQLVFSHMRDDEIEMFQKVYEKDHFLPKAVDAYCAETGAVNDDVWRKLTKVTAKIARVRGLM